MAIAGLLSVGVGSVLIGAHDGECARRLFRVGGIFRTAGHVEGVVDAMERRGDESCPSTSPPSVVRRGPSMTNQTDNRNLCCAALEQSKTIWVCAFSPPDGGRTNTYKLRAGDVDRLLGILEQGCAKATRQVPGAVEIVVCYEVGYDGFWLARLLEARGIRTIVFDPASFLRPRRGRPAKTDRLDAEEMNSYFAHLALRRCQYRPCCSCSDCRGGRCQADRA